MAFPTQATNNPDMAKRPAWTKLKWWKPDRVARLIGGIVFGGAIVLLLTPATAPYPTHPASRTSTETTVHSVEVTHPNGTDTNKVTDTQTREQPAESPGLIA